MRIVTSLGERIDGFTPLHWTRDSYLSPGDGTRRINAESVERYVKTLPPDAIPAIDLEAPTEEFLPPTPIADPIRADNQRLLAAKLTRRALGLDRPFVVFGDNVVADSSHTTTAQIRASATRLLQCRSLMAVTKTALTSLSICNSGKTKHPESSARDNATSGEKILLMRAVNPRIPIYAWLAVTFVFEPEIVPPHTMRKTLTLARDAGVNTVLLWGDRKMADGAIEVAREFL